MFTKATTSDQIKARQGVRRNDAGFTLIELILSCVITIIILGIAVTVFSGALKGRSFQTARTDAIVSAQAALNIMSRDIGNAGYGLLDNGIVIADSTSNRIHYRANLNNANLVTTDANEDVTYFCDNCGGSGGSIVRYDAFGGGTTSGIINKISQVRFQYWNYNEITHAVTGPFDVPTSSTGRVTITLTVVLVNVPGAPAVVQSNVTVTSDVTLRNSPYMLNRY